MAPTLAASQRNLIHDMIVSKSFTAPQIAHAAGCSVRGVKRFRSNMRFFGTMKAPWNGGGCSRLITPSMLDALREQNSLRNSKHSSKSNGTITRITHIKISSFSLNGVLV
jgi:hypothetical protein